MFRSTTSKTGSSVSTPEHLKTPTPERLLSLVRKTIGQKPADAARAGRSVGLLRRLRARMGEGRGQLAHCLTDRAARMRHHERNALVHRVRDDPAVVRDEPDDRLAER